MPLCRSYLITLVLIAPSIALTFKAVRLRALQDTPTAFGSTYARESQLTDGDWVKRAAQWGGEKSAAYLAMDADVPCGIAAGLFDQDDATRADLLSMWVAPTHRRLGVGRTLVEAIFEWAQARGAMTLQLMVTSNNDAAIRFYERLGFARTGRTEPYPNDPALIEYEMSRLIL